ncbi:MAG: oxygen-independent coproporphyrinogen III oxidase [Burkholderiaceae bacterium]
MNAPIQISDLLACSPAAPREAPPADRCAPAAAPSALVIDEELLRRFGGRGPRYTSYPTADRFQPTFPSGDYARALAARRDRRDDALGLYLHLPFCKSICWYCACHKIGTRHESMARPYVDALCREIDLVAALTGSGQRINHLHFGGGTPTFMSDAELGELMQHLRQVFEFAPDGEYSIEIDPRSVDPARLQALRALGLNRISLGVQDFDHDVQAAVNRIQPYELTRALIDAGRRLGFDSINIDLIYGLPKQNTARFERTLERVVAARPDRIALYHYAHLPTLFKPQRRIISADLPDSAEKGRMFAMAVAALEAAGYRHLGLDHFALDSDELSVAQREGRLHRNFQGYVSHAPGDLIAFGVSAISCVGDVYAQNDKELEPYYAALADGRLPTVRGLSMSRDDRIRRSAIQALMCDFRLRWAELDRQHGIASRDWLADALPALEPLAQAGAISIRPDGIDIEPTGRLLVRAVAMAFDRYLGAGAQAPAASSYSRIA